MIISPCSSSARLPRFGPLVVIAGIAASPASVVQDAPTTKYFPRGDGVNTVTSIRLRRTLIVVIKL